MTITRSQESAVRLLFLLDVQNLSHRIVLWLRQPWSKETTASDERPGGRGASRGIAGREGGGGGCFEVTWTRGERQTSSDRPDESHHLGTGADIVT